jgi:protein arginine N-methyltransferase 5
MYRQTDDAKVWYEWIVEVFAWEKLSPRQSASTASPSRSPAPPQSRTANALDGKDGNGKAKKEKSRAREERSGMRKVRVATSEMHSSIKEGCLM